MARRRNDAPWRLECIAARGNYCRACGHYGDVQVDHIKPRSAGGLSVVENGLPLGGPFSCACHDAKTAHRLKLRRDMLDPDQIAYLADIGWVWWTDDGEVWGLGRDDFDPVRPLSTTVRQTPGT